jgi:hypothetical protein
LTQPVPDPEVSTVPPDDVSPVLDAQLVSAKVAIVARLLT